MREWPQARRHSIRTPAKLIGTKDLPNGSLGVPAVYEVNGKQYVLVTFAGGDPFPAGGRTAPGGTHSPQVSKSYSAFALP